MTITSRYRYLGDCVLPARGWHQHYVETWNTAGRYQARRLMRLSDRVRWCAWDNPLPSADAWGRGPWTVCDVERLPF